MNPRVEGLRQADYEDLDFPGGRMWYASHHDLRVTLITKDLDLVLWADPFGNMREVGIALVDESGTMRANTRRDRRYGWE